MVDEDFGLWQIGDMQRSADEAIRNSARSVRALVMAAPTREMIDRELRDAEAAQQRGYFLPDEDERVRAMFARYLGVRVLMLEAIDAMQPVYGMVDGRTGDADELGVEVWRQCLRAFVVGFTAASVLVRMGTYVVDLAAKRPVVWKKLDEAESGCGIPRKSFTEVYKKLGSTRRMWRFHEALLFCEVHKDDIIAMADDEVVGELVPLLRAEEPFLQYRKRDYLKRKLDYSLHSFVRRHVSGYQQVMFHMFKLSGSTIAELRQPFVKPMGQGKRVTPEVMRRVRPLMEPGDVLVTRHDDAMSNLFLPGYWPHVALYIGSVEERQELGVPCVSSRVGECWCCRDETCFLEAKKDGVLFRPMDDTMQVDALMVLRPKLGRKDLSEALQRAMAHAGKLYDFSFDFCMAERLACTELIYRGFHSVGPIRFTLERHSGRMCISAEDLIGQALDSGDFEKVFDYGVAGDDVRMLQ
ncbi:hypothetical protein HW115_08715 [Verrucomicrobiaceae bacterium N1E253]|uniref:Uncharacterized protein n=1 Tax=Oceaniferula marina TaxID=2748318 RepID=A0A851GIJ2_9BACT|nr:YiiX/YebB-like N1pC/P60 family cysteine hydrolase [Oceaniferula marina]NWK55691.1 hypothetical protein [Oceaniferula marina]